MNNFFTGFPGMDQLKTQYLKHPGKPVHIVNGHIHSPYSFSAFSNLEEAFLMAQEENIKVLGLNDFFTTEGYREFHDLSLKFKIFPLFNIEFMGLMKEQQEKGIRINDPGNPGRVYFSGKGLDFPVKENSSIVGKLIQLREAGQKQTAGMLEKSSSLLCSLDPRLKLDYSEVIRDYTRGMLRERHIARAIRCKILEMFHTPEEISNFLTRLYGGKTPSVDTNDPAALENELRSVLLKAGGKAFVKENRDAFPELKEIIRIILDAGGVPCYPVLLDDVKGNLTEFEQNYEFLYKELVQQGIFCIELIPGRNDMEKLREFTDFFNSRNFIILFGTEHNTPELIPLRVTTRGNIPLDNSLKRTGYEGACVIAAHQYRRAKGEKGFFPSESSLPALKNTFIKEGDIVINHFIEHLH